MSAEVARVPLRQIGGAESSSAASVRSISSSTTGIHRATTNGPSSTIVGASRPLVTWATAKPAQPGEPRQRRRQLVVTRRVGQPDRGAVGIEADAGHRLAPPARQFELDAARAHRKRQACRASRSRRRSTGCDRTRRRAMPPMRCSRRSIPTRAATPTATCPGRRARLAPGTWIRRYRPGARSPAARLAPSAGPSRSQRLPAMSTNTATRPYGSVRGNDDELDTRGHHPFERSLEVVDAQEEPDPSGRLLPDRRRLVVAVGASEQDAGLGAGRANDDPSFRAAVVRQRRGVLDQFEPEHIDEELDRRVVLLDDDRDQPDVRHVCAAVRSVSGSAAGSADHVHRPVAGAVGRSRNTGADAGVGAAEHDRSVRRAGEPRL